MSGRGGRAAGPPEFKNEAWPSFLITITTCPRRLLGRSGPPPAPGAATAPLLVTRALVRVARMIAHRFLRVATELPGKLTATPHNQAKGGVAKKTGEKKPLVSPQPSRSPMLTCESPV